MLNSIILKKYFQMIPKGKNIFLSFLSKAFVALSGLILFGILSRGLSKNDFSIFLILMSIIEVLIIANCFGLHLAISRIYHKIKDIIKLFKFSSIIFLIGTIFSSSLFLIITKSSSLFSDLNFHIILFIFGIVITNAFLRSFADYFRASNKFINYLLFNSINTGSGIVLWSLFMISIIQLLTLNIINLYNIFFVLFITGFSTVFFLLIHIFFFSKPDHNVLGRNIVDSEFSVFFSNSFLLMSTNLLHVLKDYLPGWIILLYLTTIDSGYFLASLKLCTFILIPLSIIDVVIPHEIAKGNDSNKKNKFQEFINKITNLRFGLCSSIFIVLYILSEELILIVYGREFLIIDSTFKILLFYYLPNFLFGPSRMLLSLSKFNNYVIIIDLIMILLMFIFTYLLSNLLSLNNIVMLFVFMSFAVHIVYYFINIKLNNINSFPRIL